MSCQLTDRRLPARHLGDRFRRFSLRSPGGLTGAPFERCLGAACDLLEWWERSLRRAVFVTVIVFERKKIVERCVDAKFHWFSWHFTGSFDAALIFWMLDVTCANRNSSNLHFLCPVPSIPFTAGFFCSAPLWQTISLACSLLRSLGQEGLWILVKTDWWLPLATLRISNSVVGLEGLLWRKPTGTA